MKLLLAALFLLLQATAILSDAHFDLTKGRLILSKTDSNVISVYDLDSGASVANISDLASRASVYATEDGLFAVVAHRNLGRVRFLNSGISYNKEGTAIVKSIPKYQNFEATGTLPAHINSEYDWVAIHFDGDRSLNLPSEVYAIREKQLHWANPQILHFPDQDAHHGVAIAAKGCHFMMSEENQNYTDFFTNSSLPGGFLVFNLEMKIVARFPNSCRDYHGSGATGEFHAFGCNDGGILVIERNPTSNTFKSKKIPYPDTSLRASTIITHPNISYFIANFGAPYTRLMKVVPTASSIPQGDILTLPENLAPCQFLLDKRTGGKLLVLHPTGKLLIYNSSTFQPLGSFDLPYNFTCSTVGRPFLALGANFAYLSLNLDPEFFVYEISLTTYLKTREFKVPFQVHQMAVTGVYLPHNEDDEAAVCDPAKEDEEEEQSVGSFLTPLLPFWGLSLFAVLLAKI